jgi:tetratricopeptide (TPR) repeat protein
MDSAEIDPQSALAHYHLGEAYAAKGLHQKAFDEHMQALVLWGNKEPMEEYRQAYATSGWNGYRLKLAQRNLESFLAEWQKGSPHNLEATLIVESYVRLGKKDKAFEWLGKMFEARDGMLIWLKADPNYDRLRSDPRFTDLVRRVGLSL